ncbi:hypothetical protein pb186bvf_019858 [Paramecium bursaria]
MDDDRALQFSKQGKCAIISLVRHPIYQSSQQAQLNDPQLCLALNVPKIHILDRPFIMIFFLNSNIGLFSLFLGASFMLLICLYFLVTSSLYFLVNFGAFNIAFSSSVNSGFREIRQFLISWHQQPFQVDVPNI